MSVATLPVDDAPGRRHKWGEPVTHMDGTVSGCEETHRTCDLCRMIKITVHPPHGLPWRVWQTAKGMRATLATTPPCVEASVA